MTQSDAGEGGKFSAVCQLVRGAAIVDDCMFRRLIGPHSAHPRWQVDAATQAL